MTLRQQLLHPPHHIIICWIWIYKQTATTCPCPRQGRHKRTPGDPIEKPPIPDYKKSPTWPDLINLLTFTHNLCWEYEETETNNYSGGTKGATSVQNSTQKS